MITTKQPGHNNFKLLAIAICAIAMLLLSACRDDSNSSIVPPPEKEWSYLQLQMQIAAGSENATRGPNGGEEGDGREDGINHENEINSVILLLYSTPDDTGINSTDGTETIQSVLGFSNISYDKANKYYVTEKIQVEKQILQSNYHVIVLANSSIDASSLQNKTLKEVRDMVVTEQWTEAADIANYTDFVMTSESDAVIKDLAGNGSASEPYTFEVKIERMAARIDFDTASGKAMNDGSYVYNVVNNDNDKSAATYKFVLKSVETFNCVNSGSYLIKRVGDKDGKEIQYLGVETKSDSYATNYVICPYWNADVKRSYTADLATAEKNAETGTISAPITGQTYRILTYTQENTTKDNDRSCSTGIVLYGLFYDTNDWDSDNNKPKDKAYGLPKTFVYYIRHSDPNDEYQTTKDSERNPDGVMTYAIVRNNIYRISIKEVKNSVAAPILTINVRKWATYTHSPIVM